MVGYFVLDSGAAPGPIRRVSGAGQIMAEPGGDELLFFLKLAILLDGVRVGATVGDDVVAPGELLLAVPGGCVEGHHIVEGGLLLGEGVVVLDRVVLDADLEEEPRVTTFRGAQFRRGRDESGDGRLCQGVAGYFMKLW